MAFYDNLTIYMDPFYMKGLHYGLVRAIEEGIEKVIARRIDIEKTKSKMEIAVDLIKIDTDLQFVSDVTQLPIEKIQALRNIYSGRKFRY